MAPNGEQPKHLQGGNGQTNAAHPHPGTLLSSEKEPATDMCGSLGGSQGNYSQHRVKTASTKVTNNPTYTTTMMTTFVGAGVRGGGTKGGGNRREALVVTGPFCILIVGCLHRCKHMMKWTEFHMYTHIWAHLKLMKSVPMSSFWFEKRSSH